MLVRRVDYRIDKNNTRTIPVPRSINMYDVSGFYLLQQSLEIRSYVKMLVHKVLSARYRIAQEQFQHHWVEIFMMMVGSVLSDGYRITQEKLQ